MSLSRLMNNILYQERLRKGGTDFYFGQRVHFRTEE
jgi:hypothetical protein